MAYLDINLGLVCHVETISLLPGYIHYPSSYRLVYPEKWFDTRTIFNELIRPYFHLVSREYGRVVKRSLLGSMSVKYEFMFNMEYNSAESSVHLTVTPVDINITDTRLTEFDALLLAVPRDYDNASCPCTITYVNMVKKLDKILDSKPIIWYDMYDRIPGRWSINRFYKTYCNRSSNIYLHRKYVDDLPKFVTFLYNHIGNPRIPCTKIRTDRYISYTVCIGYGPDELYNYLTESPKKARIDTRCTYMTNDSNPVTPVNEFLRVFKTLFRMGYVRRVDRNLTSFVTFEFTLHDSTIPIIRYRFVHWNVYDILAVPPEPYHLGIFMIPSNYTNNVMALVNLSSANRIPVILYDTVSKNSDSKLAIDKYGHSISFISRHNTTIFRLLYEILRCVYRGTHPLNQFHVVRYTEELGEEVDS